MKSKRSFFLNLSLWHLLTVGGIIFGLSGAAQAQKKAFKIGKKVYTEEDVRKENRAKMYELEKQLYDMIDESARVKYLDFYWQQKAKKSGKSDVEERQAYFKKNVKVTDAEVKATLEKYKNNPRLSSLSKEEQEKNIRQYLKSRAENDLLQGIVAAGVKNGDLVMLYPQPEEPVYEVKVTKDDHVRYGPNDSDIKPRGCQGDKCAITIVEYSEFQCPFCSKAIPDIKKVLKTYEGKIRWIVRDFPLSFHNRAKPAAVAAKCAAKQNKYWEMYSALFANQRALSDADFLKYAKNIKLDEKEFKNCVSNPGDALAAIDKNFQTGAKLGVSGTPAFFINGRRLSGALPFSEFERVIEEELKRQKKRS